MIILSLEDFIYLAVSTCLCVKQAKYLSSVKEMLMGLTPLIKVSNVMLKMLLYTKYNSIRSECAAETTELDA